MAVKWNTSPLRKLATAVRTRLPEEHWTTHVLRSLYRQLTPWIARSRFPRFLERYAAQPAPAFFVQVGSNDGGFDDPIRPYIRKRGWKGILIEPLPHIFDRLKRRYSGFSGLIFEQTAISDSAGFQPFYHLRPSSEPGLPPWYDMLGSFSRENVLKHRQYLPDLEDRIMVTQVPCSTLSALLDRHNVSRVDMLNIDAEGYDYRILSQFDFKRWLPDIVLYEHRHLSVADSAEAHALLHRHGYVVFVDLVDTLAVQRTVLKDSALHEAWSALPGEAA